MQSSQTQIILAPLQGFTDLTFRNVFAAHFKGVDEAMAPFISTMGQQRLKPTRIKDVRPEKNTKMAVVPQILGNVAKDFIFLAEHLYDMGHHRINWNLGCPHSKIAKKKRGSGLLCCPEMLDDLLAEIIPAISADLSVKIRLGRKSKDEIDTLLEMFDRYDLEEIILHPRTGIQMYQDMSDWDAFEKAMIQSRHRFVYNGDITDLQTFNALKSRFPHVNRVMIGRGLLANPFLAEQIKGIQNSMNQMERLKAFHDDLFEGYKAIFSGPAHLTGRMKGFWSFLGASFSNCKKDLKKILKSRTSDSYKVAVEEFFCKKHAFLGQK